MEKKRKWHWGTNRWIVLALIIGGAFAAHFFPPVRPEILVAPEAITGRLFTLPVIGDFYLTNTVLTSMIVAALLIIMAFFVNRSVKKNGLLPRGIAGALEMLLEYLYGMTESTAGKWAGAIFPFFATIVLVVLLSNLMDLVPGVDSIGWIHHISTGHALQQIAPGVFAVIGGNASSTSGTGIVIPWFRAPSTDLNFTLALALISVGMTQVIGIRAQGLRYFSKFFNTSGLFTKPIFGAIDFLVGFLETISEFSKILSFSFRLFGNIFAGSVLLFIVGSMIPVFAQSMILMFEFFIALIQAVVFGLLTMVFMSMATQGHGEHKEEHSGVEQPATGTV